MKKSYHAAYVGYYLMTLMQIATDAYLPSMPHIMQTLHASKAQTQLSLSLFLLGFGLSQFIYGPLADRFGRRPVLFFGLSIFTIMNLLAIFSPDIHTLLLARFFSGFGAGACSVIARTLFHDLFTGKALAKVTAMQSACWSVTPLLAPIAGGYIQHFFGWRYCFAFLALCSFLAIVLARRFIFETLKTPHELHPISILKSYRSLFSNHFFIGSTIIGSVVIASNMIVNIALPFIVQIQLGFSVVDYSWIIFACAISFILGTFLNRLLLNRFSTNKLACFGISLALFSSIILLTLLSFFSHNIYTLMLPTSLMLMGQSFIYANVATHAMMSIKTKIGLASAVFGGCVFLISGSASWLVSALHATREIPFALCLLALNVLAMLIYIYLNINTAKTNQT